MKDIYNKLFTKIYAKFLLVFCLASVMCINSVWGISISTSFMNYQNGSPQTMRISFTNAINYCDGTADYTIYKYTDIWLKVNGADIVYISKHTSADSESGYYDLQLTNYKQNSTLDVYAYVTYKGFWGAYNDESTHLYPLIPFDMNLQATTDKNTIGLVWNDYKNVKDATGFIVEVLKDNGLYEMVPNGNISNLNQHSYTDERDNTNVIPGMTYTYRVSIQPSSTNLVATVNGKKKPNGVISGKIKTPDGIESGIGIANATVKAELVGSALPTDPTTSYSAITDGNGNYTISNIYYSSEAKFLVTPVINNNPQKIVCNPANMEVTLKIAVPEVTANFTDTAGFVISGTITQDTPHGTLAMPGVALYLNNIKTKYTTDENGTFNIPVDQGGTYTIKPELHTHTFNPAERTIAVATNVDNVNFSDTKKNTVEGYVNASCGVFMGKAKLSFSSVGSTAALVDEIETDNSGFYQISLPARKYNISVEDLTPFDAEKVNKTEVLNYFSEPKQIDLTAFDSAYYYNNKTSSTYDSTRMYRDTAVVSFTYHNKPELTISGLLGIRKTCPPEETLILAQSQAYNLEFQAEESFLGSVCPADKGYVIISENISSLNNTAIRDSVSYQKGDTIRYKLVPGYPNLFSPYTKSFEAVLHVGNSTDTIKFDALVEGHQPRTQTFETVAPSIPYLILHSPPGDGSSCYLEKGTSISGVLSTSIATDLTTNMWAQAKVGAKYEAGQFILTEVEAHAQLTATAEIGLSLKSSTELATTLTTSEKLSVSGDDLFVGGALNYIYAKTDQLAYNDDSCKVEKSVNIIMAPNGFATTFVHTKTYVDNYLIPELQGFKDYYTQKDSLEKADYYNDQIKLWNQILALDSITKKDAVPFVPAINYTFNGSSSGASYEKTVTTQSSIKTTLTTSMYLSAEVAAEAGFEAAGSGASAGVKVTSKVELGGEASVGLETTKTVGYTLADKNDGDKFTLDVLNDNIYGVPVFQLKAGSSMCPHEEGTLAREGLRLISNVYSRKVGENDPAVFVLELNNSSQSDEEMTYDLVFDHASNPDGAILTIGGSPVVGNVPYPYTIPAGGSKYATVTVRKGPSALQYNNLKFVLRSECDGSISDEVLLNADFSNQQDGINDLYNNEVNLKCYPNPTNRYVEIKSENIISKIAICDILGKSVYELDRVNSDTKTLDLKDLSNGIYLVRVTINNQVNSFKLRVEK